VRSRTARNSTYTCRSILFRYGSSKHSRVSQRLLFEATCWQKTFKNPVARLVPEANQMERPTIKWIVKKSCSRSVYWKSCVVFASFLRERPSVLLKQALSASDTDRAVASGATDTTVQTMTIFAEVLHKCYHPLRGMIWTTSLFDLRINYCHLNNESPKLFRK